MTEMTLTISARTGLGEQISARVVISEEAIRQIRKGDTKLVEGLAAQITDELLRFADLQGRKEQQEQTV